MAITSGHGARIDLEAAGGRRDETWFGECAGTIVVAINPDDRAFVEELLDGLNVPVRSLGSVDGDELVLDSSPIAVERLRAASERALSAPVLVQH
jgi:hypothetical protein